MRRAAARVPVALAAGRASEDADRQPGARSSSAPAWRPGFRLAPARPVARAGGAAVRDAASRSATNLVNDAADFEKGADTAERLGPTRVTQSGLLPRAARDAARPRCSSSSPRCSGSRWSLAGGVPILVIGLLSLVAGYAYTTGPFPLAYRGLGEIFVILFFGFAAVKGMAYVLAGAGLWPWAELAALQVGLQSATLLAVNNARDIAGDRKAGKRTLAARFGLGFARAEIAALVALPFLLGASGGLRPVGRAPRCCPWQRCRSPSDWSRGVWSEPPSRRFNVFLAQSALLQLVFSALLATGLVLAGADVHGCSRRPGFDLELAETLDWASGGRPVDPRQPRVGAAATRPPSRLHERVAAGPRRARLRRDVRSTSRGDRRATALGGAIEARRPRLGRRRQRPPRGRARTTSGRTRCRSSTSAAWASWLARGCRGRRRGCRRRPVGRPSSSGTRSTKCARRSPRSCPRRCTTWWRPGSSRRRRSARLSSEAARLDPELCEQARGARLAVSSQLWPHRNGVAGGHRPARLRLVPARYPRRSRCSAHAEARVDDEERLVSIRATSLLTCYAEIERGCRRGRGTRRRGRLAHDRRPGDACTEGGWRCCGRAADSVKVLGELVSLPRVEEAARRWAAQEPLLAGSTWIWPWSALPHARLGHELVLAVAHRGDWRGPPAPDGAPAIADRVLPRRAAAVRAAPARRVGGGASRARRWGSAGAAATRPQVGPASPADRPIDGIGTLLKVAGSVKTCATRVSAHNRSRSASPSLDEPRPHLERGWTPRSDDHLASRRRRRSVPGCHRPE